MSKNVIPLRAPDARQSESARAWSLETALRRLGFVRIAPVTWPDGAESFAIGRFVAVRPDCPTPTSAILVEVARLTGGPRRAYPYAGAADAEHPATRRAELVADCVRTLAEGRTTVEHVRTALLALPVIERERIASLARRIHAAGLEPMRPGAPVERVSRMRLTRGKPGSRRVAVRG